jgi:CRISPR/Cas system-associated exonuclease Cas4 (RecB family)
MTIQYIIIGTVLAICLILAVRYFYQEWRENVRYKNYGCAGCAFYEKCKRKKKR